MRNCCYNPFATCSLLYTVVFFKSKRCKQLYWQFRVFLKIVDIWQMTMNVQIGPRQRHHRTLKLIIEIGRKMLQKNAPFWFENGPLCFVTVINIIKIRSPETRKFCSKIVYICDISQIKTACFWHSSTLMFFNFREL